MSERSSAGDLRGGWPKTPGARAGEYVPPKTPADVSTLRDRIVARFDRKTGSNSAATHGPLIEAILEELFPVPEPADDTQEAP